MDSLELLSINTKIYSLEAIRRTCFDLIGQVICGIVQKDENTAVVTIPASLQVDILGLADKFKTALLDHQIRIDTEKSFKTIRELIVAQAFAPCESLDEIIKELDV
jgi:His-Xaa-Ser system protein HxsD